MPVAGKPRPLAMAGAEPRAVQGGPAGDRVRASPDESKRKNVSLTKQRQTRKPAPELPESALRNNVSVDTMCSTDSTSSCSSAEMAKLSRTTKRVRVKPSKLARNPPGADAVEPVTKRPDQWKRCDWVTPHSDPLYISFHDEEWGVPVHDDWRLFELLVFSQALAELSWPTILAKRDIFRKHFDNFDASSVARYDKKKLLLLKVRGSLLLSEPKLRAVVENAKQIVKIQSEFGSFDNYCWSFIGHKPIRNGFRYVRQVPVKTPKAEVMGKNMMQRGFCCVGPTVVYSFMQAAGLVNDHLLSCFRFHECTAAVKKDSHPNSQDPKEVADGISE